MSIDWSRLTYLAIDGTKTIWTYQTNTVAEDAAILDLALPMLRPKLPKHELVKSKSGIAVIFGSSLKTAAYPVERIRATIGAISDTIVDEGMGKPGRKQGIPE